MTQFSSGNTTHQQFGPSPKNPPSTGTSGIFLRGTLTHSPWKAIPTFVIGVITYLFFLLLFTPLSFKKFFSLSYFFFFFLRTFLPPTHSPFSLLLFLLPIPSSPRSLTQPSEALCPVPRAVAPRPPSAGLPQSQASSLQTRTQWLECPGPYRMKRDGMQGD